MTTASVLREVLKKFRDGEIIPNPEIAMRRPELLGEFALLLGKAEAALASSGSEVDPSDILLVRIRDHLDALDDLLPLLRERVL